MCGSFGRVNTEYDTVRVVGFGSGRPTLFAWADFLLVVWFASSIAEIEIGA